MDLPRDTFIPSIIFKYALLLLSNLILFFPRPQRSSGLLHTCRHVSIRAYERTHHCSTREGLGPLEAYACAETSKLVTHKFARSDNSEHCLSDSSREGTKVYSPHKIIIFKSQITFKFEIFFSFKICTKKTKSY